MRWKTGILTVGIVGVVGLLAAMGISYVADRYAGEQQLTGPPATPELVARGAYLAKLGDCAACHSIPGKPPYSGGLRMVTPIGAIYTTNITPDPHMASDASAWLTSIARFGLASPRDIRSTRRCLSHPTTTPRPRTLPRFMPISSKAPLLPSFQTARVISLSHSRCVGR